MGVANMGRMPALKKKDSAVSSEWNNEDQNGHKLVFFS